MIDNTLPGSTTVPQSRRITRRIIARTAKRKPISYNLSRIVSVSLSWPLPGCKMDLVDRARPPFLRTCSRSLATVERGEYPNQKKELVHRMKGKNDDRHAVAAVEVWSIETRQTERVRSSLSKIVSVELCYVVHADHILVSSASTDSVTWAPPWWRVAIT